MKNIKKSAQSLIEYGLILALVAVIAITVLSKFGKTLTNSADTTGATVENAASNSSKSYCCSLSAEVETGSTKSPQAICIQAAGGSITCN